MDHSHHDMASMTGSAMPTGTAAASMGGHDMGGHGMGGGCKISMLWNWYTVDACFLSSTWHITSSGMFAGSCIGVILLVMSLELLRRVQKEYDSYLRAQHRAAASVVTAGGEDQKAASGTSSPTAAKGGKQAPVAALAGVLSRGGRGRRPTAVQQAVRALIHMVQFAVAYIIMLLAMYYNGYIIICIIIGAFLGYFAFSWTELGEDSSRGTGTEVTGCCG